MLGALFPGGTFFENLDQIPQVINPFRGIDFSVLYSWLPGDIADACAIVIAVSLVLWAIGLVKKLLPTA